MKNVGSRMVGGSALRVIVMGSNVLVSFFLIPFLIHSLGQQWYGMWILACSFMPYYSILDLGFSTATQRFVAHALARDDRRELNEVISTSLALFSAAGALAALLGLGLAATAPFFVANPEEIPVFRMLVIVTSLNVAFSFPAATFHGLLSANLRFEIDGYLQMGKLVLRTAVTYLVVSRGYGILALAYVTLAVDMLERGLRVFLALRVTPGVRVGWPTFHLARVKALFNFGSFAFLARVPEMARFSVGSMIIARVLSLSAVSTFSISVRLTEYYLELLASLAGLMMPVFTRYHSAGDTANLKDKLYFSTRLAVMVATLAAGGILIFGRPFIGLWMGPEFLPAYAPMAILVAAMLAAAAQNPSLALIYAMARHKTYAIFVWSELAASVVLCLALVGRYGMVGVALGTALPILVCRLIFLPPFICRLVDIPLSSYLLAMGRVFASTALIQVPVYWLAARMSLDGYVSLLGTAFLLYLALAAAAARFLLPRSDRETLANALPVSGWLR